MTKPDEKAAVAPDDTTETIILPVGLWPQITAILRMFQYPAQGGEVQNFLNRVDKAEVLPAAQPGTSPV